MRGTKTGDFFSLRAVEEDHAFRSGLVVNTALKSKGLKMTRGKSKLDIA